MENVTEALFLAFAVLTLVIALSMGISAFSSARETSDMILRHADATTRIEYEEGSAGSSAYRIVGLETIIPNLYRYNKEKLRIVFLKGSISGSDVLTITGPLTIYTSQTNDALWSQNYTGDALASPPIDSAYGFKLNSGSKNISVFDTNEESSRNEPWQVGDSTILNNNIKALISGGSVTYKIQGVDTTYNYAGNPLTYSSYKYAEVISRETKAGGNNTTKQTTITYVKI